MSGSLPLVSIGLPVYNGEKYLARALDSLLAQDYSNIEFIVSDNCSTDNTRAICAGYAQRNPRVRLSATERNIGATGNFERVLKQAKGEYFMWAACDDYWLPTFVSTLVRELEEHQLSHVAMCATEIVRNDLTHLRFERFSPHDGATPNEMTSIDAFKMGQYGGPIWIYLYGLFRTSFLRRATRVSLAPPVLSAELIFLAEVALATRLRYVDQVLQVRIVHEKGCVHRYPNEPAFELRRTGQWSPTRDLPALKNRIWRSEVIPLQRKLFALLWLELKTTDWRGIPGGEALRHLYRVMSHRLG